MARWMGMPPTSAVRVGRCWGWELGGDVSDIGGSAWFVGRPPVSCSSAQQANQDRRYWACSLTAHSQEHCLHSRNGPAPVLWRAPASTGENAMNTSVQTHAEAAEEAVQSAVEVQRFPEKFEATVTGNVQHRVGDGQLEDIPRGTRVQVATAIGSYVLSWTQEDQPITVSLAKREFELYVDTGRSRSAKPDAGHVPVHSEGPAAYLPQGLCMVASPSLRRATAARSGCALRRPAACARGRPRPPAAGAGAVRRPGRLAG